MKPYKYEVIREIQLLECLYKQPDGKSHCRYKDDDPEQWIVKYNIEDAYNRDNNMNCEITDIPEEVLKEV